MVARQRCFTRASSTRGSPPVHSLEEILRAKAL
nr:MAG TPA: hypothetical protein [Caudoviricetes sp.]